MLRPCGDPNSEFRLRLTAIDLPRDDRPKRCPDQGRAVREAAQPSAPQQDACASSNPQISSQHCQMITTTRAQMAQYRNREPTEHHTCSSCDLLQHTG